MDPPDPLDLLIAHTEDVGPRGPRPLDFVRAKFAELKRDNKRLRDRVADLEQTLSIVQTAQEWTVGKGMTPEQAKKAREDLQNFSGSSRQALYEKLRACKNALH